MTNLYLDISGTFNTQALEENSFDNFERKMKHLCFYAFLTLILMVATVDAMCMPIPCPPECPKCGKDETESHFGCNCFPSCVKHLSKGDPCEEHPIFPFGFGPSKLALCGKGLKCTGKKCQ
ncbi:uncharacterized protein NPIL_672881 [Nephila pilipes]|uniref:Uncharacterized protein n=1 Tax=Nephila pilipes TaxID=299642 RepID=A0A8X6N8J8_NEPPI|nr:uncharacterized protein NPIL_672881 [Nephila pilipes]